MRRRVFESPGPLHYTALTSAIQVDVEVEKNFYDPELSKVPSSEKPKVEAKHGIERVVDRVKESMHGSSEKS